MTALYNKTTHHHHQHRHHDCLCVSDYVVVWCVRASSLLARVRQLCHPPSGKTCPSVANVSTDTQTLCSHHTHSTLFTFPAPAPDHSNRKPPLLLYTVLYDIPLDSHQKRGVLGHTTIDHHTRSRVSRWNASVIVLVVIVVGRVCAAC